MRRRALLSSNRKDYFAMVVTTGGDITWTGSTTDNKLSYSKDNGITWSTANSTITISVVAGNKILWKGTPTPQTDNGIGKFSGDTNARYSVEGNVMSLLYGDNFNGKISLEGKDYALTNLFIGNTNVTSAKNLSLSATTLVSECYRSMFQGCTSLTTAPELPATTLAKSCYSSMFQGCTGLTIAPELPATTLAEGCYYGMFFMCTSLTTVPSDLLPATTLAESCYRSMFNSCRSLTTVPSDLLPATTLASDCYRLMFQNCRSLTTAPELPATTLASYCYYMIFNNCSLTTAPELPATTLAEGCYRSMFQGCTGLTIAPELPATTLAVNCYYQMFNRCTSLTTAPELPATTLAESCYNQMFLSCTSLSSIKCLATDISASNCTYNWVSGVAASGTFTKAASMTSWTTGVNGIPSGWTVDDGRVVAKFNVTSTSNPTQICYSNAVSQFSAIEIDGVVQSSVVSAYTFSTTGEHTVKYTLTYPTSIGESAFRYCESLASIDIPNSVTSIGEHAFDYCISLTSCTIGSSVTNIGNNAFNGCRRLTSISIPSGVTIIGVSAFQNCTNLTSITSNAITAPTINYNTFQSVKTGGTLTVPQGSIGYDEWMSTYNYYLGKYNWTKVEQ